MLQQQAQLVTGDARIAFLLLGCAAWLGHRCISDSPAWVHSNDAWVLNPAKRFLAPLCLVCMGLPLGFVYADWWARPALEQRLSESLEGQNLEVVGTIVSLPSDTLRGRRFDFRIEQVLSRPEIEAPFAQVPEQVSLAWYDSDRATELRAGQRWQWEIRLKRPHASQNPQLFDMEAWWIANGVGATGYVRQAARSPKPRLLGESRDPHARLQRLRDDLRQAMQRAIPGDSQAAVLTALALGDQRAITREAWLLYQRTGVGHLMSISGLHVTMIGWFGAWLARCVWRRSRLASEWIATPRISALSACLWAWSYTLVAGSGLPAVRTALMVTVVAVASITAWKTSMWSVLALALGVVVVFDPWASVSTGFWLSFLAVAVLVASDRSENGGRSDAADFDDGQAKQNGDASPKPQLTSVWLDRLAAVGLSFESAKTLLMESARAQAAITLGLAPISALLFFQLSTIAPVANAVAIPVVSFIVTPLALLGAALAPFGVSWPLELAASTMRLLEVFLKALDQPWSVVNWPAPSLPVMAMSVAGVILLVFKTSRSCKGLGAALLLPLLLVRPDAPPLGAARVHFVDVGQGSAVLIQTHRHWLLYDTGPSFGTDSDAGDRVLLPLMRAWGVNRLAEMIVSHADIDHSGGALSILKSMPVDRLWSSIEGVHELSAMPMHQVCAKGLGFEIDGVRFVFLHPSLSGMYRDDNAKSCVLRVESKGASVILPGDIPKDVEFLLIKADVGERSFAEQSMLKSSNPSKTEVHPVDSLDNQAASQLRADVLLAPHHGSKTSSSQAFIEAVAPRYAVVQAGYRSRFGHPHREVIERYASAQVELLRSDRDGAIRFDLGLTGLRGPYLHRAIGQRYWFNRRGPTESSVDQAYRGLESEF